MKKVQVFEEAWGSTCIRIRDGALYIIRRVQNHVFQYIADPHYNRGVQVLNIHTGMVDEYDAGEE